MQTYSQMKGSGVAWLGDIPAEWKIERVKWAFDRKQVRNKSDAPVVLSLARTGVKVRDISTNEGQLAESYLNYNVVEPDDVLLNPMDLISGANCSISKVSGVISPAYVNVRPITGDSRYFDYYFKLQYWSNAFFVHGRGVSYDNRWTLNAETIMNYPVLVPDLETQEKIADFLDAETAKVDNLIARQRRLLELLDEKRRATITAAVTSDIQTTEERFRDICELNPATHSDFKADDIVSFYPMDSIGDDGIISHSQTRPYSTVKTGYTVFQNDDVTVAKVTPCFENYKGAHMTGIASGVGFGTTELLVLRANKKVTPAYLYWLTQSHGFNKYLTGGMRGTGGLKRVVPEELKSYKVNLPTIETQRQIVSRLSEDLKKFELLTSDAKKQVELLKEHRVSLISSAVTGKIKV